jgi:UDP-N-acetylmuramoylalanine-D-glutamate ligase
MGGEDRNVDYSHLCDAVNNAENVAGIVILGDTTSRLHKALLTTKASIHPSLSDDVGEAVKLAAAISKPGDYIVFTPGAPTPQYIGDFQVRSAQFIAGMNDVTFS